MAKNVNFNELFGNDNSIVIRIEKLLAGESFEKLQKVSEDLLKFYIAQFSDHIDKCKQELKTLPKEWQDAEYQEYLEMLKLIENVNYLNKEDLQKLAKFTINSTSSIENNMRRLSVIPNHNAGDEDFTESDFVYNDELDPDEYDAVEDEKYFISYMKEYMILPKREQINRDIKTYQKEIKQNQKYLNETLCLAINRDVLFENVSQVFSILKYIKSKSSKNIELVVDKDGIMQKSKGRVPYSYNENQINMFSKLIKDGLVEKLFFSEFYVENYYPVSRDQIFYFSDIYDANLEKNDFVKYNKSLNLSPFEFLISAHLFIMPNDYEEEKSFNIEKCRTFLTSKGCVSFKDYGFVCSAFASYGKALVDEYADKNLSCDFITIYYYDKDDNELNETHSTLLVHIKDEKYKIDGHYLWDLTYDSNFFSIAYCLYPVADLLNFKDEIANTLNDEDATDYFKILFSRPDDVLDPETKNYIYEKYKDNSKPISIKKYKYALINLLNKIEKSGAQNLAEFLEGHSTTKQQYIENLLCDTILNLDILDPQKAQNSFYKKMRDFYTNTTNPKYKDWKKKWDECNTRYAKNEKDW